MRLHRIVSSSVALLLYHIFPRHLVNGTVFGSKKSLNRKCVRSFLSQMLSETFLVIGIIQRDVITNTGRFIMFSVITNIYNKKTKGPTLMEFFTATGKLKKSFYN